MNTPTLTAQVEAAGFDLPLSPEQGEMPFAMVLGEPMTEMPRDLYIPPQALEVFLDAFEGPLDLLLYLIRRQNLDILDIPIAEITRQYTRYIELMSEMQLELAGEYLVMAATLAEIKSRMLLPRASDPAQGTEDDPRAELVRRLQEYERFKRAAEHIDAVPRLERDHWLATAAFDERRVTRLLPEVSLHEMLLAFREVALRAEMFAHHHVQRERLADLLETLFRPEEGRMGVVVTFMAMLQLVREGLVDIVQTEPFAPLHVRGGRPSIDVDGAAVEAALQQAEAEAVAALASLADEDDEDADEPDGIDPVLEGGP